VTRGRISSQDSFPLVVLVLIGILVLWPRVGWAQTPTSQPVRVLPAFCAPADSGFAVLLQRRFVTGIRPSQFLHLLSLKEVTATVRADELRRTIGSVAGMREYSDLHPAGFLIGTVIGRDDEGNIALSTALYGYEEETLLAVRSQAFADTAQALARIHLLARELTHPRNFSLGDEAFFYSLILPGSGQAHLGKWAHAALSAGLVGVAVLYGVTTPEPDQYRLPDYYFKQVWEYSEGWRFFVAGQEVSHDEYFDAYQVAVLHKDRAERQREDRLTFLAWLFNLADTLLVSRPGVDGTPFFDLVASVQTRTPLEPESDIRFHLCIPLSGRWER